MTRDQYKKLSVLDKASYITQQLIKDFPTVETPLFHKDAYTLLVATMMSAQTLDTSVNKVTPILWEKYKDINAIAKANPEDISKIAHGINYNRTKAINIVNMSKKLLSDFDGKVPSTIEELTTLPGVGRKTANVVISEWFAKQNNILPEGFVVDTHVIRVSNRLGLSKNTDPKKIEQDLMKIFPREEWSDMCLRLIFHGRFLCKAISPKCYLDPFWGKICGCVPEMIKKGKIKESEVV